MRGNFLYQVLYRKYRPKNFSDVVGQDQVTVTLQNELKLSRIAHAYLFTGSRGTGKTTCAKILAKAINCEDPDSTDACGKCKSCIEIENGTNLDVVEIDAASNNGVENIRNLIEEAFFTPASSKYRVYIIDEVHMLSIGAFNALLKTLEEPSEHVVFILATTEVHKLPATILSRCQRFDFHRISKNEIADRLRYVSNQEGYELSYDAALLIAKIADGALRDALSILDQCMGKGKLIDENAVIQTVGICGKDHIYRIVDSALKEDVSSLLKEIDELSKLSKDMMRLAEELMDHFRDIMIIKSATDARDLIAVSESEYEMLVKQADKMSLEKSIYAIDILQSAICNMAKGANKRIELEMSIIKIASPKLDSTNQALLARISKLERDIMKGSIKINPLDEKLNSKQNDTNLKEVSINENNIDVKKHTLENAPVDMKELTRKAKKFKEWPEVLKILKSYSKVIATAFNGSSAYISENFVLIDAKNTVAFELLRKSAQRDKMRVAIQEVTGKIYKLGPYKTEDEQEKNEDPLDSLKASAKDAGVNIVEN